MRLRVLELSSVCRAKSIQRVRTNAAGWFSMMILALMSSPALTKSDVIQQRNGWTIERVFGEGGGFEGCGASTMSADWRLGLAHSFDGTWEMLFSRPSRPFEAGEEYGVDLIANGRSIYRGTAEVLPNGLAFLSPELSESAIASLRRTARLVFATQRGSKTLQLQGASEVIDTLRDCVRRNSRDNSVAGRPPGRPGGRPFE
jgi:hypothetical protein